MKCAFSLYKPLITLFFQDLVAEAFEESLTNTCDANHSGEALALQLPMTQPNTAADADVGLSQFEDAESDERTRRIPCVQKLAHHTVPHSLNFDFYFSVKALTAEKVQPVEVVANTEQTQLSFHLPQRKAPFLFQFFH